MASENLYDVLGVSKTATEDEIKSAFRQKAKKYHPDLFQNASEAEKKNAEEQFKKINHAYQVLSDKEKKARYDQFGTEDENAAFGGYGAGFDGGFDDVLKNIFNAFGGGFAGGGSSSRGRQRMAGDNIQIAITLTFEEAFFGCEKDVPISRTENCPDCKGSGAKNGNAFKTCPHCNGTGYVTVRQNSIFGQVTGQSVCPDCSGSGRIITDPCKACNGKGRVKKSRTVHVKCPAGLDNDNTISYPGEGEVGKNGGPNGNLIVFIRVKPHALFKRNGIDLYAELPITFLEAANGAEIKVPTMNGPAILKVPEGTQTGTLLSLKGKGAKAVKSKNTYGDLYFKVTVETPSGLTRQQKEQLQTFNNSLSSKQTSKRAKFNSFIK